MVNNGTERGSVDCNLNDFASNAPMKPVVWAVPDNLLRRCRAIPVLAQRDTGGPALAASGYPHPDELDHKRCD